MKRRIFSVLIVMIIILSGCSDPITQSGWVVYWDYASGIEAWEAEKETYDTIVAFAAILDSKDCVKMLPAMDTTIDLIKKRQKDTRVLLSVVNDVEIQEGQYASKNTEILYRLFASEESRSDHINQLIELCKFYDLDGIELDYESIRDDVELWTKYTGFLRECQQRMDEAGLDFRVVIGSYDVNYATFPEGPEYVVMCYNLYGPHTDEAGPKADETFLRGAYARNKALPGDVEIALANGGFVWGDDGSVQAITQEKAEFLHELYLPGKEYGIDEKSRAITFAYTDQGINYEVWFANEDTIKFWSELAYQSGYKKICLWRLGG